MIYIQDPWIALDQIRKWISTKHMNFGIYLIFNKYTKLGISTKMTKKDPFLVQNIP